MSFSRANIALNNNENEKSEMKAIWEIFFRMVFKKERFEWVKIKKNSWRGMGHGHFLNYQNNNNIYNVTDPFMI